MKTMREKIRLRNIEIARFSIAEKIRITSNGTIFVGYNEKGDRLCGKSGDEFSVPKDLSRESSTKLLNAGFAEPAVDAAASKKAVTKPTDRDRHKLKLREVIDPIEMIQITGSGARTRKTDFFLGRNDDGESLTGKVGDTFSIKDGEISEELARKLIRKGYAVEKKKSFLKKLIDKI